MSTKDLLKDKESEMNGQHEQGVVGDLVSKLPTEILFEILVKLSIKTLSRCRFVCKLWFQTIRNPSFITTYNANLINNNDDNNSFVIIQYAGISFYLVDHEFETSRTIYTPSCPLEKVRTDVCFRYSSNGLLLLVSMGKYLHYHISNPITLDDIVVPRSPLYQHNCVNGIGFGYDPVSEVCKIIRVLSFPTQVEVYNLVTGKWRVVEGDQLLVKSLSPNASVDGKPVSIESFLLISHQVSPYAFVNGALHWYSHCQISPVSRVIISFNLDTEEFHQLSGPPGFNMINAYDGNPTELRYYLLVVRECLSLVFCDGFEHVEIWVMKDYGFESTWEKNYIIKDILMDNSNLIKDFYRPIKFMQNGDILLITSYNELGYYQPVTKAFRSFGSLDIDTYSKVSLHEASLDSPGSIANKKE